MNAGEQFKMVRMWCELGVDPINHPPTTDYAS